MIPEDVTISWFQSTLPRRERLRGRLPYGYQGRVSIHAPTKGATQNGSKLCLRIRFQSTLPRRERLRFGYLSLSFCGFNPRSHEGSDCKELRYRRHHRGFNPRSHEGSDRAKSKAGKIFTVSIHAPTKGATVFIYQILLCRRSFNPRSHEGSDLERMLLIRLSTVVSIHAPTKGATRYEPPLLYADKSFNPRSHEGSDSMVFPGLLSSGGFNPRSHEGSDNGYQLSKDGSVYVSIHAPTKGATEIRYSIEPFVSCFNPRSHEGSDRNKMKHPPRQNLFQSTLPRRERHGKPLVCTYSGGFQSTLPRRERQKMLFTAQQNQPYVSIHAPTKGATLCRRTGQDIVVPFQSTLPRRERRD